MNTANQNTQSKPAAQALSDPAGSVFELVDCTNDESYFPMGLFLSLEDALAQVKDREEPPTDDPEEIVRMEVRERQIGKLIWWDNGKTVATIQWIQDYIEAKDEWVWHTPTISFPKVYRSDMTALNQTLEQSLAGSPCSRRESPSDDQFHDLGNGWAVILTGDGWELECQHSGVTIGLDATDQETAIQEGKAVAKIVAAKNTAR